MAPIHPVKISAYIPCYNNQDTIAQAIASVQGQSYPIDDVFVIDDGSSDDSVAKVQSIGIRIVRHEANLGRGAIRARAMREARNDLVLCCDATNAVAPDFITGALPWFDDSRLAGVFGRITQPPARNVVERWRGRHLFRLGTPHPMHHGAMLSTHGAVVRRSAVMAVGNFAASLRHTEDGELGTRLLGAGYDIVYDPNLLVTSVAKNSLFQVLERRWRWQVGIEERVSWPDYLSQIAYSVKVMVREDLRDGDPFSVPISLLSPHYQFWKSKFGKLQNSKLPS